MSGKLPPDKNPIRAVAERFGGPSALARALGKKQSTVWEWCNVGRLPYCAIISIIYAGRRATPPIYLRPDDFFHLEKGIR